MVPFGYYRAGIYMLIPLGLALLLLPLMPLFYGTIYVAPLRILVISLGALSAFIVMFQPKFAKPDWINWLEGNHSDILPVLRRELWHMVRERKEIINDQEKLEAWIQEYRQKRGLQRHRVSRDVV